MISKTLPTERTPINLQGGWPTPRLHPAEDLQTASQRVFARDDIGDLLRYGPEHGFKPLRHNISQWMNKFYGCDSGSDNILITNGASNGLATILQKFADPSGPTKNIWMVEPTYFLACPIFRDAGFSGVIRGVPEGSSDGIDLAFFKKALEEVDSEDGEEKSNNDSNKEDSHHKSVQGGYLKTYRHVLYMVPTFSNPSGRTMSLDCRRELIRIARQHDVLVITDDVYDMICWEIGATNGQRPKIPPRLVDIDQGLEGTLEFGNAVSNGSFSKIVAPGVRVGWLQGTEAFIVAMGTVGASVSGGCQSHMSSLLINEMLSSGAIDRHLTQTIIPLFQQRHRTFVDAIRTQLSPFGVTILTDPQGGTEEAEAEKEGDVVDYHYNLAGGFFLYIMFPTDSYLPPVAEIAKRALEEYNLKIAPGGIFTVVDDEDTTRPSEYAGGARLCWAWHEEDELVEGIERLAEVLSSFSSKVTINASWS